MAKYVLHLLVFTTCCVCSYTQQIVAVLDSRSIKYNPNIEKVLSHKDPESSDISVVIEEENNTVATFETVCKRVQNGTSVLIDMSSTATGPLIRSFAREHGLVYMTITDESLVLPNDRENPYYIQIQPPGSAMLNVVADIVKFENLTRVAILYDDSFDLHETPRRIISGLLSHHIYLDVIRNNITQLLNILVELEIESVFIIASARSIGDFLGEANGFTDLNNDDINWFAITKDAEVYCETCELEMRVVIIFVDSTNRLSSRREYLRFMEELTNQQYNGNDIKVDEAFSYDISRLFSDKIPQQELKPRSFRCYGDDIVPHNNTEFNKKLMKNLKNTPDIDGMFGPITIDVNNVRQKVKLKLKRYKFDKGEADEQSQIGVWTQEDGLELEGHSLTREKTKKTYRVVVVPEYEPFIYKHNDTTSSKAQYSGFCWDLFQKIKENLNFDAEYHETADGYFGSLKDDGTWNGAINELIEKKADIAIGPISVMSERENVVDFTVPFHEPVGLTILMKKHKFEYSLTKFLKVLDKEVWGVIFASFFLFSILMWLFDKFSPYSYQNNPSSTSGPEKRIFTLKESIWFCMTSLTPQGGGEAPKAISGRLVAAFWWLYGFLLIAFYTANLAAFLTVTRLETPISSLDDLSKQQSVKYGPMNGTSALVYFRRMKEIETQFYQIWKDMSLNDSLSPVARAKLAVWDYPVSEQFTKLMSRMKIESSYQEALELVRRGEFAFIDDATRNKYQTLTDCDVEEIGEEFSRKPFAFAVSQGSPLRAQMSNVILELANNRVLEELTNRWWDSNSKKKTCPRIEDESDGISINNIGGVFLVIAIGTCLSLIAFVMEYYYYKIKPNREARLYDIHRNKGQATRTQSETTLEDIQIQDNGDVSGDYRSSQRIANGVRANKLSKRKKHNNNNNDNHNHVKENHKDTSNGTVSGDHHQQNGHVVSNGGVRSSYFVFDSEETISDRYPDLYDQKNNVFSERL